MQDFVLALDLDRVIFDTNEYFKHIDSQLAPLGTSMGDIFSKNGGRKDLGCLYDDLSRRFGKEKAEEVLFKDTQRFLNKEIVDIAEWVMSRDGRVVIISVGDSHQKCKLRGFPHSEIFPVHSDGEKLRAALSLKVPIFIDDKRSVIERLRSRGINAHQAVWFLDEKHRQDALEGALKTPAELKEVLVKLLKP